MNSLIEEETPLTEEDRPRIMRLAEAVLADLERQIAEPISIVWRLKLPDLQEYMRSLEQSISYWRKLLPGSSEIERGVYLHFIEWAKWEMGRGKRYYLVWR